MYRFCEFVAMDCQTFGKMFTILLFSIVPSILGQNIQRNVAYGNHPAQVLDLYLPCGGGGVSKALVLLHGGGWSGGSKDNGSTEAITLLRKGFPNYALANLDFRLGSVESPGYPKQLQDIGMALEWLKSRLGQGLTFALIGDSSGAHLSLLYGYGYDTSRVVRVIVNIVGFVDLTDPGVAWSPSLNKIFLPLSGTPSYYADPGHYFQISPVAWIGRGSPKTISFYGDEDQYVPSSQGLILKARLDRAKVTNELHTYHEGHFIAAWSEQAKADMAFKIKSFLDKWF